MKKKNQKRQTSVRDTWIDFVVISDSAHPFHQSLTDIQADVWIVYVELVTGTLPSIYKKFIFKNEDDAEAFLQRIPAHTLWTDHLPDAANEMSFGGFNSLIPESFDGYEFEMDRRERWLADEILLEHGISDGPFNPSDTVVTALGSDRVAELHKIFSRKYGTVAMFEYCRRNFGPASIEFIAANYKFQMEIVQDYFAAGYLLRDLQLFQKGIESRVSTALATDFKAGQGGTVSSQSKRDQRALAILREAEKIRFGNPLGAAMESGVLVSDAKKAAVAADPKLWNRGQGQISQYFGLARDGELGEDAKRLYFRIFTPNPLKRKSSSRIA